ncbi:MAG: HupE/UreJ family protein [Nevskia sp.]
MQPRARYLWLVLPVLVPAPAYAHLSGVKVDDFWLGLLHPLISLEDAAAFVALGLLAGQAGETKGLRTVATFCLGLGLGAMLGASGVQGPWVSGLDLASLILLGALVAIARELPLLLLLLLAAVFGLAHGLNNGIEAVPPVKPWLFALGLMAAGFFVPFYGMLLVTKLKPWWTKIGVRVVGSWIAATGLLVLALDFAKAGGRLPG